MGTESYRRANCTWSLQRSWPHCVLTQHHSQLPTQKAEGTSPPFRTERRAESGMGQVRGGRESTEQPSVPSPVGKSINSASVSIFLPECRRHRLYTENSLVRGPGSGTGWDSLGSLPSGRETMFSHPGRYVEKPFSLPRMGEDEMTQGRK